MLRRFVTSRWAAAATGAVVVAAVLSASGAFGGNTPQQYTGCLAPDGNLRQVKIGTAPLHTCAKNETQISWSQTGPPGTPGTPGTSITTATVAAGANCANGGASFTDGTNTTYACNGAKGDPGDPGPSDITPAVGRFTPTQLVEGAILTCSTATTNECDGLKLNGLQVRLSFTEGDLICNTVTGTGFNNGIGVGNADNPHFIWNGTNWELSSTTANPLDDLTCSAGP
jgi:hypothetical protein